MKKAGLKIKVGIIDSNKSYDSKDLFQIEKIGQLLYDYDIILCTEFNSNASIACSLGHKKMGGFNMGISPAKNFKDHLFKKMLSIDFYDTIIYSDSDVSKCHSTLINNSDILIFLGYSKELYQKTILQIQNSCLHGILSLNSDSETIFDTNSLTLINNDPKSLIQDIFNEANHKHYFNSVECHHYGDIDLDEYVFNTYRDPVCGMWVDPRKSILYKNNEEDLYFCSNCCLEKFINNN